MKGQTLTVNTLVILVLAVIVLIGMIAFFMGVWTPSTSGIGVESIKNSGCQRLVSMGCDKDPGIVDIGEYGEGTDKTKLIDLCEDKYGCSDDDDNSGYTDAEDCCRAVCGCSVSKAS